MRFAAVEMAGHISPSRQEGSTAGTDSCTRHCGRTSANPFGRPHWSISASWTYSGSLPAVAKNRTN